MVENMKRSPKTTDKGKGYATVGLVLCIIASILANIGLFVSTIAASGAAAKNGIAVFVGL